MKETLWHSVKVDEAIKILETSSQNGLADAEVRERLAKHGLNELTKEEKVSPFSIFINQFKNILILILIIAIILSVLVGEYIDAGIIALIVVFVAILGFVQEYKAERALDALKKMLSPSITVKRNGKEIEVLSKELVPGDILVLEAGDKIPADARLFENHSLKCDEASLTGESFPVSKDINELSESTQLNDRKNMLFTGTAITYGRGLAVVTATGMNTEFGKIAKEVTSIKTEKTPLEKRTDEIGKWLSIFSISICGLVIVVSLIREYSGGTVDMAFAVKITMFGVALAVAAVPEALAAIVTGALAIGMHQMAKRNALIRKMPAVETLGCTTVICSDKTGTLTKGEMTIRKIFVLNNMIEVSGTGYEPIGELKGVAKDSTDVELLLKAGILCNDSELYEKEGKWQIKGDSTEAAILVAAAKYGMKAHEVKKNNERIAELPFSSERKMMSTIHNMKEGKKLAFIKGAPDVVLKKCSKLLDNSKVRDLTKTDFNAVSLVNDEMAKNALRVLALSYKDAPSGDVYEESKIENDMVFIGLVGMMDPPREEVIEATRICKQVHIKPVMITGDHKLTAVAVAKEIGFYNEGDMVLTGEELDKYSDEEFEKIVNKVSVYARVSPINKLKIVNAWKKRGEVVAMTGDGVNDAPALKHADIGIAMGITGTEVTKEAADMVLTDDNFATIVKAIELGRWIYDNIKKYLTYLLRCNIVEVVVIGGIVLILGPEYLPLLPAAILYINLGTDGLPALALGVAPADPDIMQRPPRDPKESVFSKDVMLFILLALLIEIPFFYYIFFKDISNITHARTEMFFLFIFIELVIALNFRSMKYSIFKAPPHKWLVLSIAWEIVLLVMLIQIPAVCSSFGINKPVVSDMAMIAGFGVVVFIALEATKAVIRKWGQSLTPRDPAQEKK
ncbi:MAG: cation-translocating P-type ATPase [Elusimicrobia bacterium]|nr:cation-translocating P-type ATPase [Candidatus Liberimonas magnetica]